ncbi:MAG TPA: bifunctional DNA-formamidopyrimidine glycosylase/DNA-(apurinic or apyrimidinic site) lyase [Firmicutes bacterium]|jgi:formamidopyrimidine-DNA glycosylase|nr:bifunctional DNA-formamidopyrimidine glycosylase/DNA-(apurinic or apyrimidinic site) lyase [Bacillota bacterium]
MPELPEVETIRKTLAPYLPGKEITGVEPRLAKAFRPDPETFAREVTGRRITGLSRRGKYLILSLDSGKRVAFHLRMSGRLLYSENPSPPPKHTTLILRFKGGEELLMEDPRKFGTVHLFTGKNLPPGLAALGPEATEKKEALANLRAAGERRKAPVKTILLDQTVLAGLGNIYTDEALFLAGIDPSRPVNQLSPDEWEKLYTAIRRVLTEGLAHRGTSQRDYVDGKGEPGTHQEYLRVYGRRGKPCPVCGQPVSYKRVAGRGTHYCRFCQQ